MQHLTFQFLDSALKFRQVDMDELGKQIVMEQNDTGILISLITILGILYDVMIFLTDRLTCTYMNLRTRVKQVVGKSNEIKISTYEPINENEIRDVEINEQTVVGKSGE